MTSDTPVTDALLGRLRGSAMLRILGLVGLILLLQIPITMIDGTISERSRRRTEAIEEVTQTWGHRQEIRGPFLVVPYVLRVEEKGKEPREETYHRYLLPATLAAEAALDTEVRRRGIFDVPLYVAHVSLTGSFRLQDRSLFPSETVAIRWEEATLALALSDPKSIRDGVTLTSGDRALAVEPGLGSFDTYDAGFSAALGLSASPALATPVPFAMTLTVAGSDGISVLPVGDETSVHVRSGWPDPSFDGAYLPIERTVTDRGFDATWRVNRLARSFPSWWKRGSQCRKDLDGSLLGVSLLSPVEAYRTTERAVKYQLLFVGLTFLTFFLFELLGGLRVHPVQYLLVGLALCLFYLLLLSLAEHVGFDWAYTLASTAIAGLVTSYSRSVLRDGRGVGVIAGLTTGLYAYLFVLLQIQDYALLVGSLGLFAILASVMWVTRRVDWYAIGTPRAGASVA
jgi:inner membrane protein